MLGFYIGSVLVCCSSNLLVAKSIEKKAKSKGYKLQNKKFLNKFKLVGISAIPLFNFVMAVSFIGVVKDKKNPVIEEMIKDGILIKIEEDPIEHDVVNENKGMYFENNQTDVLGKNDIVNFESNNIGIKQKIKQKRR